MTKILLDTHVFLWLVTDDRQLSNVARTCFLDANQEFYLSAVTSFEIAVKYSLRKLKLAEPPKEFICNELAALPTPPPLWSIRGSKRSLDKAKLWIPV